MIYICSPNNPTGAVFSRERLKQWVDYANRTDAVLLFDAAYEAFIEDEDIPHSIFEIEGAKTCAIEICSLSKTAGFTGTRLGYTVIPRELERNGMRLNEMWIRNRTTKTNGVSYIIQKGGAAVFTEEGQKRSVKGSRFIKRMRRCSWRPWTGWGSGTAAGKNCALHLDEVPWGNGKLGVFRLPAPGDPGSGNAGRRLWSMRGRIFPVFHLRLTGGYKGGGRTAGEAAGLTIPFPPCGARPLAASFVLVLSISTKIQGMPSHRIVLFTSCI